MKTLHLTLLLAGLSLAGAAQTWNTSLNDVPAGEDYKLGTKNASPLRIFANDTEQMTIGADGTIKFPNLTGDGDAILYVDGGGNMARKQSTSGLISYCLDITPWYLGGNKNTPTGLNKIGTCDAVDFILKANDNEALIIKTNGYVGIGKNNSNPQAPVDISSPLSTYNHHLRFYGDDNGSIESTYSMNLFHDDEFFIRRGPYSSNPTGMPTPFMIDGLDNTHMLGTYINGKLTMVNGSNPTQYEFFTDNNGVGHIAKAGGVNLLNFKESSSNPQVWIGGTKPTGTHSDFKLAVAGKVLAQAVYVTATAAWADYVFKEDYKLRSLEDVELFYRTNRHLPDVPSESEIVENGINTAEMDATLLRKIEELTLYVVELNKKVEALQTENKQLKGDH